MSTRPGRREMRLSPARWMLYLALPADERDDILAELDETRAAKFPAGGLRARTWYWRQACSFSVYFIAERYHEASRDRHIDRVRARRAEHDATPATNSSHHAFPSDAPQSSASSDPGPQIAPPELRHRKDHNNMRGLFRDIAFSLRQLTKQPGFALAVVFTLALGIGPNPG